MNTALLATNILLALVSAGSALGCWHYSQIATRHADRAEEALRTIRDTAQHPD